MIASPLNNLSPPEEHSYYTISIKDKGSKYGTFINNHLKPIASDQEFVISPISNQLKTDYGLDKNYDYAFVYLGPYDKIISQELIQEERGQIQLTWIPLIFSFSRTKPFPKSKLQLLKPLFDDLSIILKDEIKPTTCLLFAPNDVPENDMQVITAKVQNIPIASYTMIDDIFLGIGSIKANEYCFVSQKKHDLKINGNNFNYIAFHISSSEIGLYMLYGIFKEVSNSLNTESQGKPQKKVTKPKNALDPKLKKILKTKFRNDLLIKPVYSASDLFSGISFIFFDDNQYKSLCNIVEALGGNSFLYEKFEELKKASISELNNFIDDISKYLSLKANSKHAQSKVVPVIPEFDIPTSTKENEEALQKVLRESTYKQIREALKSNKKVVYTPVYPKEIINSIENKSLKELIKRMPENLYYATNVLESEPEILENDMLSTKKQELQQESSIDSHANIKIEKDATVVTGKKILKKKLNPIRIKNEQVTQPNNLLNLWLQTPEKALSMNNKNSATEETGPLKEASFSTDKKDQECPVSPDSQKEDSSVLEVPETPFKNNEKEARSQEIPEISEEIVCHDTGSNDEEDEQVLKTPQPKVKLEDVILDTKENQMEKIKKENEIPDYDPDEDKKLVDLAIVETSTIVYDPQEIMDQAANGASSTFRDRFSGRRQNNIPNFKAFKKVVPGSLASRSRPSTGYHVISSSICNPTIDFFEIDPIKSNDTEAGIEATSFLDPNGGLRVADSNEKASEDQEEDSLFVGGIADSPDEMEDEEELEMINSLIPDNDRSNKTLQIQKQSNKSVSFLHIQHEDQDKPPKNIRLASFETSLGGSQTRSSSSSLSSSKRNSDADILEHEFHSSKRQRVSRKPTPEASYASGQRSVYTSNRPAFNSFKGLPAPKFLGATVGSTTSNSGSFEEEEDDDLLEI